MLRQPEYAVQGPDGMRQPPAGRNRHGCPRPGRRAGERAFDKTDGLKMKCSSIHTPLFGHWTQSGVNFWTRRNQLWSIHPLSTVGRTLSRNGGLNRRTNSGRELRGLITAYKNSHQTLCNFSKTQGSVLGFESCSRELRIYPRRSLTTGHAFVKYINSDVQKHEPQQQGTPRHPPHRAEREYPLQVPVCPRHGDDSRNDNGTPAQPQSQTMGAALSEWQLG